MYRLIVATILLAIVLAVLLLRRGNPARTRVVNVTSRVALHRGAFVAVVEVDGRRLLVGAGAHQVTLLSELDPVPPTPSEAPADEPVRPSTGRPAPTETAIPASGITAMVERVRRATTRVPRSGGR